MISSSYRIPQLSAWLMTIAYFSPALAQQASIESLLEDSAVMAEWGGNVGLGAIATSGNSEASTLQADFGLSYRYGIWHNAFSSKALHARAETTDASGVVQKDSTSERYTASLRSALDFSENNYLFALIEYEKDLFAGVRETSVETLGYGRRLLNSVAQNLDVELGAGARQSLAQGTGQRRESEIIARGGLNYVLQITETSRFVQKITVESGSANTSTESVTELKLAVIGGVYANLGFTWKHNSDVPVDSENEDTISSVSLSWEF